MSEMKNIFHFLFDILQSILTLLFTKENEILKIQILKVKSIKKERGFSPLRHASFSALLKQSIAVSN